MIASASLSGASTTGLVAGTRPMPAGSAASRNSSSRTCVLRQTAQWPEYLRGSSFVTAALAAPLTMGSVTASRIALTAAR